MLNKDFSKMNPKKPASDKAMKILLQVSKAPFPAHGIHHCIFKKLLQLEYIWLEERLLDYPKNLPEVYIEYMNITDKGLDALEKYIKNISNS